MTFVKCRQNNQNTINYHKNQIINKLIIINNNQ